ncbi:MAG: glycosyltransferase family 4 protein [Planctomycetota bacterium]
MTISHFAQVIGDFGEGGDGRMAVNLAAGLAGRGIESTCISLKSGGAIAAERSGVRPLQLGSRSGAFGRLADLREFSRFIRVRGVDVLHAHGPRSLLFAWLATRAMVRRPRLWFTWHDSETVLGGSRQHRLLVRRAMGSCDRIFGSSRAVVAKLKSALPGHGRIEVFTNGVPVGDPTRGHDADVPTIIWTGRLVPPKDPGILIPAAGVLRDEGIQFKVVMAGSAPRHLRWFEEDLRRVVQEAGLSEVVTFPGWIPDLSRIMLDATIAVQTSHTEGLSMALLEQMMAGLAVIATDVGDTELAVSGGDSGILIPPKHEAALLGALRELICSPALRRRMGDSAREIAQERFSTDSVVDRVLELGR